jgi:mannose-6-phosphate isomerase-like protein (cupin superfamily)
VKSERTAVKTAFAQAEPYITKDGSEIRELMHPDLHGVRHQSLAHATVPPGCETRLHRHKLTEEIYHVTGGAGVMKLGDQEFSVAAGDTVVIRPGTAHAIRNTGTVSLTILCACAPAYAHEDTELL